jgi:hypothetical protein
MMQQETANDMDMNKMIVALYLCYVLYTSMNCSVDAACS